MNAMESGDDELEVPQDALPLEADVADNEQNDVQNINNEHENVEEEFSPNLIPVAGREEDNVWRLPRTMAEYFNINGRQFVRSRQLREQILDFYPPPSNIDSILSLDEYVRTLIRNNNNNFVISLDDDLKYISSRPR